MLELNGTSNGADKTNGASHPAIPVGAMPAMPAARERPALPPRNEIVDRLAIEMAAGPDLKAVRDVATASGIKLQSTTRVINAFMGYVTNSCGRASDQLRESDVAALGTIMAALEGLEVSTKPPLS